jgi:predicted transcriptional regulator
MSAAIQYVDVNEFMAALKSKGLLIVSSKEWEAVQVITARKLMKKRALSLSEIANNDLLGKKMSKRTVERMIESGVIKPNETFQETTGNKKVMILTAAINRLNQKNP